MYVLNNYIYDQSVFSSGIVSGTFCFQYVFRVFFIWKISFFFGFQETKVSSHKSMQEEVLPAQ